MLATTRDAAPRSTVAESDESEEETEVDGEDETEEEEVDEEDGVGVVPMVVAPGDAATGLGF
jgi:hypothetical protein